MTQDLKISLTERDALHAKLVSLLGRMVSHGESQMNDDRGQRFVEVSKTDIRAGRKLLDALQSLQPAAQVAAPEAGIVHPVPVSGEGVQGAARKDAERYRKLRRWMGSNVAEGWGRVEQLGAICAWLGYDDFDKALDTMPNCNVGLSSASPSAAAKTSQDDLNPTPPVLPIEAGQQEPGNAKYSDEQIKQWAERHDLGIASMTDLRCIFEDAATTPPAQEAAEPSELQIAIDELAKAEAELGKYGYAVGCGARGRIEGSRRKLQALAAIQAPAQKDAP